MKKERKYPPEAFAGKTLELFGITSCAYAGATAGMTGRYTVDEMRKRVAKWRKKEAK